MNDTILRKLEASRQDLLDLGLRNPLVSFRPRKSGLEIVDESGSEVLRMLVAEGRAMTFAPLAEADANPDDADAEPGKADPGDAEPEPPAGRHRDACLQTKLDADELALRLLKVASLARTHVEEQGVNVLYLAVGFLDWYEAESAQAPRRAPLLLVPVRLERSSARERFRVRHDGEDVGDNLSLKAKLRNDFAIELPGFGDGGIEDPCEYLRAVAAAVEAQPRWSVAADDMYLGFFSFGKFLMYNDLDPATWPDGGDFSENPLLAALLGDGFREPASEVPEDAHLDEILAPDGVHTILDADSSQTVAILDAVQGRNLVVQGPPGTGKSQTIANLIAEALARDKKVLFVAEKMAALDVVKRRLDAVGIGDAALELHSHKTVKKAILDELNRTLHLGRPRAAGAEDDIATLTRLRDRLNAYAAEANTPVGQSGVSPVAALGHVLRCRREATVETRFDFGAMASWSAGDQRERRALVEEVSRKLDEMGRPVDSPFWGSGLRYVDPISAPRLAATIEAAGVAAASLDGKAAALAAQLGLARPGSPAEAALVTRAARRAMEAPREVFAVALASPDWRLRREDLAEAIGAGAARRALLEREAARLLPEAWDQDLLEVRGHLVHYGRRWWRFLSGKYRRARSRLRALSREDLPRDIDACLAMVEAVMEARRHRDVVVRHEATLASLFGEHWRGVDSDWEKLAAIHAWVAALVRDIDAGTLPAGLVDFLARRPAVEELREGAQAAESAAAQCAAALAEVDRVLELDPSLALATRAGARQATFEEIASRVAKWKADPDALARMAEFHRLAEALGECGLGDIAGAATSWPGDGAALLRAFDLTWYEGLYSTAAAERRSLRDFDRASQEQALEHFRRLDAMLLSHIRGRLVLRHWEKLPRLGETGELGILGREIHKKTRQMPIRRLVKEAGRAIQAIKPLFMMSPMSIATYIPPGAVEFDLVIFDEASQVRPVEALGALLRGRQAVVVGDSRQLPPTSFFAMMGEVEEEDEDNVTADQESILGLFNAQNAPSRMLRWHYRSRHESLIAVSNREFYEDRLVVFPSAGQDTAATGLAFEHLPGTAYDRGGTRTNVEEARAVAERVMRHARETPELTLGVVAFSTAQRDAIETALEALRKRDSTAEDFFASNPDEPFFVKNLENVQGDERDVILISVGYGKTADGRFAQSFGPLNLEGGERRLNVLISRARLACRVYANFTADDLDLAKSDARGVAALKTFLHYAATRRLEMPKSTGRGPDSVFEEQVLASLRGHGLDVEPQVGVSGFFVDIGVRDADQPGRYVLGIECDGASYHSARSARDRDRLREAVLRGLGWEIHRIWSTDWFRNPGRETERVLEAVEKAKLAHRRRAARTRASSAIAAPSTAGAGAAGSGAASSDIPARGPERSTETKQEATDDIGGEAYRVATVRVDLGGRELFEVASSRIASWVEAVVKVESPVHREEVARRITTAAGYSRAGSRLVQAVEGGIEAAVRAGSVRAAGDFLWSAGMREAPVRDRSALESSARRIEWICDEEIAAALRSVVERGFSMPVEEAVSTALAGLGLRRPRSEARERATAVLDRAVDAGAIQRSGDTVARA